MSRSRYIPALLLLLLPAANAQRSCSPIPSEEQRLGGIAGAIAGGIIGENNDEAGAAALIGGAIGALAGGAMGNARDKELQQWQAQRQYQAQQQVYAQQQQQYAVRQGAVSNADVIAMARSGLSDSIIVNQIMERGVQNRPEVSDIIQLHQNGVSEAVISSMQRASVGSPVAAPVAVVAQPPVVVERHVEVVPTYVVPAPRYYYPPPYHRHRHRHGSSIGFSFGF